jgi:hypothetical protein
MLLESDRRRGLWRTLLILGRVSNLPTVWSNCLAGWFLGGGGHPGVLLGLCAGATCLYLGGMFLNDAFDADFDRLHRRERPIPAGHVKLDAVWGWGFAWLGAGTVILVSLGNSTGTFAALLLFCILLYDAVHKLVSSAPVLMAACRFFLYLVAASAGVEGVTGLSLWGALALAVYVIGVSYLARHEQSRSGLPRWPALLLGAPLVLAILANTGEHRLHVFLLVFVVGLWLLRCLQPALAAQDLNVRRCVEGLLAGIVLVDLLALGGDAGPGLSLVFLGLFAAALILQRFVPAT